MAVVLTNDTAPWDDEFITPNSLHLSLNVIDFFRDYVVATPETEAAAEPDPTLTVLTPSPCGGACRLTYSLPSGCVGELSVSDVAGRWLVVLAEGQLAAGIHSVTWSGRDDRGKQLAPGMYFVRLSLPTHSTCKKLIRVR